MRTALYTSHVESGANLVDFHGFELPIWYSSIKEEHLATRSAGMFDAIWAYSGLLAKGSQSG